MRMFILFSILISGYVHSSVKWNSFQEILTQIVKVNRYISIDGDFTHNSVDYKKLKETKVLSHLMNEQVNQIKNCSIPPSFNDKLAFWINAYNFFTVVDVATHFPITSMKSDLGWSDKKFMIAGSKYSLDQIEHKILRPMKEPLIHFAINCASVGCPTLSNLVFKSENIKEQLEKLVRNSFKNPIHLKVVKGLFGRRYLATTKILDWFEEDFKKIEFGGMNGIKGFINKYGPNRLITEIESLDANISYDWNLNSLENIRERMNKLKKENPSLKLLEK